MVYEEIISALRNYSELVEVSSQQFESDIISGSENTDGGFEEIICSYIDAVSEIKRIRNRNKRLCLVYDALGYLEYQIAETLRMSQPAVNKNIRWLKRFFSKVVIK
jgi:hypothetical protein